jgi:hypothetical protein
VHDVSAAIRNGANDLIDWQALRTEFKKNSTDVGAGIVEKWNNAPSMLTSREGNHAKQKLS